jgi:hypothetical protein
MSTPKSIGKPAIKPDPQKFGFVFSFSYIQFLQHTKFTLQGDYRRDFMFRFAKYAVPYKVSFYFQLAKIHE